MGLRTPADGDPANLAVETRVWIVAALPALEQHQVQHVADAVGVEGPGVLLDVRVHQVIHLESI
jgi:hypothetical protein